MKLREFPGMFIDLQVLSESIFKILGKQRQAHRLVGVAFFCTENIIILKPEFSQIPAILGQQVYFYRFPVLASRVLR
ncbi:MAG: hypothetical protein ACOYB8_11945 [Eubacteriaceae bacterium]